MNTPRILVIRPDRIGDVVLSIPVLRALRERWPEAYIAMMVRPYTRAVLTGNPWIDDILTDDPHGADRGMAGCWRQAGRLRARRFDTALLLLPTMRLAWMLWAAGIPRRISVGRKVYHVLTRTRSISRHRYVPLRHEADYCLDLARAIGAPAGTWQPAVFLTEEERAAARDRLAAAGAVHRPLVGLHPGNGHNAPNWAPERYGALAEQIHARFGGTVVVTGSGAEQALLDRMRAQHAAPLVSLVGQLSLRQLMAVIGALDVLVSSSTGPMHLAAALEVPTVSLFCPLPARSPQRWAPLSERSQILLPSNGACPGCDRGPMCDLADIPLGMALAAIGRQLTS
jgi:heptosyltransferase-2